MTGADEHTKSPAQVMLRWHLQQGRSAIPKSTNPVRIAENFNVSDFELTEGQMANIDALDTGTRSGPDPDIPGSSESGVVRCSSIGPGAVGGEQDA
ncbi:aldo/keto reductase family protein [Kribbella orskensis]|uniref:Aldo/keto reductase family protein n=1 Tax=Kribbella orskensis TaxID=2512216 RepID=A0ABY2B9C7_9ACTN|nr:MULTISPECIES: aldo/keto reductase [Kribbella]TCN28859.1 aldo/keto reductase family protein [Kribbella sp. VKM Ac-2500]TCO08969.1 aldo/keto reductase family protein [Kribbella orskensis]